MYFDQKQWNKSHKHLWIENAARSNKKIKLRKFWNVAFNSNYHAAALI